MSSRPDKAQAAPLSNARKRFRGEWPLLKLYPVKTPAGEGWIGICPEGIGWLSIGGLDTREVVAYWRGPVEKGIRCPISAEQLVRVASGEERLPMVPAGTDFQYAVWEQLMRVPCSSTCSYGELAAAMGAPGKARAVGTAVGANPVAWLIPCHRILPGKGGTGNYRWGTRAKEKLLEWERNGRDRHAEKQETEDLRKLEALLLNAQRFEDISRLAGHVAHDLNNLLAPIRMATEMLKAKLQDSSLDRYVEIIETSTGRARAVIQEILAFSRETEGGSDRKIRVQEVLNEIEKLVRETFPASISIDFDYPDQAPPVWMDPDQLHRAILNLLLNARDAIQGKGRIRVEVSTHDVEMRVCVGERCLVPGHYVCIAVSDTGCGIPEEIRGKIFDPFFTTKPGDQGTGLGLASVFGIIARAGGFIDLESRVGNGSAFRLYLPEAKRD